MAMPQYAQNAIMGQGQGGGLGPFNYQPGSYANIFYGLFGDAGSPYKEAQDYLSGNIGKAQKYQEPFYQAGVGAINDYQKWLQSQQNPSGFINSLMGQYQESPYARYLQDQAQRAGINAASASGLIGSTPFAQQMQQNAANISSQDMQNWLSQVLGINTQYGQGVGNLMTGGQNAGNVLTQLMNDYLSNQAGLRYGRGMAEQGQQGALFSGITGLFGL